MKAKEVVLQSILDQGMLPLFYWSDAEVSIEIIKTLYKAGVRVFEYTNRGSQALENFKLFRKVISAEMPDMYLGVGTIKSIDECNKFIEAGADFIVSPIVNVSVGEICNNKNMLWVPGCMTPTEIYTAQTVNAALIKIFPANIVGHEFVSSIKELFRGQLFIPTGGVDVDKDNIATWFKSGVCSVGMGSKLISKSIMENKNYEALYNKTVEALEIIKACKPAAVK